MSVVIRKKLMKKPSNLQKHEHEYEIKYKRIIGKRSPNIIVIRSCECGKSVGADLINDLPEGAEIDE